MLEVRKVPGPLFTLRGHNSGVTALAEFKLDNNDNKKSYLISGDEDGTIIVWDLDIYRKVVSYQNSFESRIQSLKSIVLVNNNVKTNLVVVQTRDHGIFIIDIEYNTSNVDDVNLKQIASFPTYPSIFSKGDAINIKDNNQAILSYPSCLENCLVTVRILSEDAKTILSGTAQRSSSESDKKSTIFDLKLKTVFDGNNEIYLLAVAYEDGHLCIFKFSSNYTKTVPHLQSTGLDIKLIKSYDLKIGDFISAFDLLIENNHEKKVSIICGTPLTEVICVNDSLLVSKDNDNSFTEMLQISLKNQGVSTIKIRPDGKLFVAGCWDNKIRLYSMKSKKLLATLSHHYKQVHDVLFIEKDANSDQPNKSNDHDNLLDNDTVIEDSSKKFLLYCASVEGTISIISIY